VLIFIVFDVFVKVFVGVIAVMTVYCKFLKNVLFVVFDYAYEVFVVFYV